MDTPIKKTKNEWKKQLGEKKYKILRERGTEPAFTGKLLNNKAKGVYTCGACGAELFSSGTKYDSGSGWPSFYDVTQNENLTTAQDTSHGMNRMEISCAKCGSHLGHVFDDGPNPTGKRYCVNSASLNFQKYEN